MANLRDRAIEHHDLLAKGHWKAPSLQRLQRDLNALNKKQLSIVRRCVVSAVDAGIHDFLFALQELAESEDDIQVLVQGENIGKTSDGLHGELFSDEGWYARFSAYGKPPEEA